MDSGRRLLFAVFNVLLQLVVLTIAQTELLAHYCNYYSGDTYTSNSTFQKNLDTLPSFLTSNASFYNFSIGLNDSVNVVALCRIDVESDRCRTCLNDSNSKLRDLCRREKESIGWSDDCMLRYSSQDIFKTINTSPYAYVFNSDMAQDVNQFNRAVRTLLESLQGEAARGGSIHKFATGNASGPNNLIIYGLVQCTPDLSEQQCKDCLNMTFGVLPTCCDGKIEGRVVTPSCHFRYGNQRFYSLVDVATPPDAPPTDNEVPPPPSKGNDDNKTQTIVIVTVVPTIALAILVCLFIYTRKRKLKDKSNGLHDISSAESLQFDFDTIKVATKNFSDSNKLGQGGFGAVYKGKLLDGREIAVKRLSKNSGQGELEFKNEALLLAKLQHRSLVRLLGYSLKSTERLLIYEFVPNGSLDNFIFGPKRRAILDVDTRYNIIKGVARGLLYLHEDSRLKIIHRDLKASNILLDAKMYPKIADFGMARLFGPEETRADTSRIVGTYGYMAPEYVVLGQFSVKSDVFSFGVLVLEIISGQRNNFRNGENIQYFLSYAWKNWRHGRASGVIDPTLRLDAGSAHNIMRCIHIALLCVQEKVADRPTMASVVLMLNSPSQTLPSPSEPAFFSNDSSVSVHREDPPEIDEDTPEINESAQMSVNEASITDLSAR